MHELLVNLTDNAIRYTPAGGQITLGVACVEGGWLLSVEDNGPGIAVSERERVFERFYRVLGQSQETGCGLGLAIVAECVQALHGQIQLDHGSHGLGLRVTVFLPAAGPA